MVSTSNPSGAKENPITPEDKGSDKTTAESDQSSAVPNVEKEPQQVVGMGPVGDNNGRESTTGTPKRSNPQGVGGPVRGGRRTQPATKGVQRGNTGTTPSGTSSPNGEEVCRESVSALNRLREEFEVRDIYKLMYSEEL